ncbi:erythronate-4-phosphate dehydrogenase [Bacteroidales bacterium]|nr:erythronate-4-phosphate dehydrogenase [Bacteroidales bacterium]
MKILADNKIPFLKGVLEPFAEMSYLLAKDFTHENIKDAEVLIVRTPNKCTRSLLEGTKVKFIATSTIGFDHIDIDYCVQAGIGWTNCPGCNAVSVSQYIIASVIEMSKKEGFSIYDKTYGIVGVGNVGKEVERVFTAMGMRYLLCDPPRALAEGQKGFVDLQTICSECDIITFHVPLNKAGSFPTYHLADAAFFDSLKRRPYIINAARGGVHDTKALLNAKKAGLIRGMIIDCWENEPNISLPLLQEVLIGSPHVAGFSADGKGNGTRMCLEAIAGAYPLIFKDLLIQIELPCPNIAEIDLNNFCGDRIQEAILSTFSPLVADKNLRAKPEGFEYQRTHYDNPREFHAYTIKNASAEERIILINLGFLVE